jgi:hypothetical protein
MTFAHLFAALRRSLVLLDSKRAEGGALSRGTAR